jgi:hypothetical protein
MLLYWSDSMVQSPTSTATLPRLNVTPSLHHVWLVDRIVIQSSFAWRNAWIVETAARLLGLLR